MAGEMSGQSAVEMPVVRMEGKRKAAGRVTRASVSLKRQKTLPATDAAPSSGNPPAEQPLRQEAALSTSNPPALGSSASGPSANALPASESSTLDPSTMVPFSSASPLSSITPTSASASGSGDSSGDPDSDSSQGADKPGPWSEIPLTATSRWALIETLPWFRSLQGGTYTQNGVITGFYISNCELERGHVDADIVITRCGGHHAKVGGKAKQISDAKATESQVVKMRENRRSKIPFPVIIGKEHQRCPVKLEHEFNVMAWFQVTDVWAEKKDGFKSFLYRLERIRRGDNLAWWAPRPELVNGEVLGVTCTKFTCAACHQQSKRMYRNGEICLNDDCVEFWKLDGQDASRVKLVYNSDFLGERTDFPDAIAYPFDMVPPEPSGPSANETLAAAGYDRRAWKGFVCRYCKQVCPRRHWFYHWCQTCRRKIEFEQPTVTMPMIRNPHLIVYTGHPHCTNFFDSRYIHYSAFILGWYTFRRYDLGHGNLVFHVQSSEQLNTSPGGPDAMLHDLQTDRSLELERRPMHGRTGKSEGLVNHFSQNFGLPYKFVVAQDSHPFSTAPGVIKGSLARCQWIAEQAIGVGKFSKFNEVLVVAYMEEGGMGYHDDGETTLGDTVVAMCIGGDATMKVRLKDQHYRGFRNTTSTDKTEDSAEGSTAARTGTSSTIGMAIHPNIRVPEGALLIEERRALNARYKGRDLLPEELERHSAEWKATIMAAKERKVKIPREAKDILELNFKHGDFFVMHGPDVQTFYEHGVSMKDKLRFALTCRHVLPLSVEESGRHLADFDHAPWVYEGVTDGNPPSTRRLAIDVSQLSLR